MNNKHKRVLWLLNHTTLREFEVPLLRSLGYEVYTPKVFSLNDFSGTVDYQFDESLTIPKAALETLNNHDFYHQPLNYNVRTILNNYFSFAFPGFFLNMVNELIKHFNGHVLMRFFGQLETTTYTWLMRDHAPAGFSKNLNLAKNRVWFTQSYTNLMDVEAPFLQARAIDLPLGLPDSIRKNDDQWVGGNNNVLFVCPRIASAPEYYGKIFREFERDFSEFPYIVAGGQPIPVPGAKVAGFQPRHIFDEWLRTCKVMYYHSCEPRHLHYHPLEAVSVGMPLVYMRGGLLEHLGGAHQPGACHTVAEAKAKIKRILNDDKALVDDIRNAQKVLLETFTFEYCQKTWQKNFVERFKDVNCDNVISARFQHPRKIAIFLPTVERGGRLTSAKTLAKMLHNGSRLDGVPATIVFSCIEGAYSIEEDFADLLNEGIQIRETVWSRISRNEISEVPYLQQANFDNTHNYHQYPVDHIANFEDCDFWLILSDLLADPILAIKPYGMVAYDYVHRYVPEMLQAGVSNDVFLSTTRRAQFVLTTTPQTRTDSIQYAGVNAENSHLLPMEFIPSQIGIYANDKSSVLPIGDDYFIWTTNGAPNKNHLKALDALELYYKSMGGKFSVLITDPSGLFTGKPSATVAVDYWKQVQEKVNTSPVLKEYVRFAGYLKPDDYLLALAKAKFIWHPALMDNGTFSVVDAAYQGVPALSSDYPQMHYINERFRLNMRFCQASNPKNMAEQLKQMETLYKQMTDTLPEKAYLDQFSYKQLAPEVWRTIKELI